MKRIINTFHVSTECVDSHHLICRPIMSELFVSTAPQCLLASCGDGAPVWEAPNSTSKILN